MKVDSCNAIIHLQIFDKYNSRQFEKRPLHGMNQKLNPVVK